MIDTVLKKKAGHRINEPDFIQPPADHVLHRGLKEVKQTVSLRCWLDGS
jgi:hypothetical protein